MNKFPKIVLTVLVAVFIISFSSINNVPAAVNLGQVALALFSQQLVSHRTISDSSGSWQTTFTTAGLSEGNRMNVFYRNDTNANATVRVERLVDDVWFLVLLTSAGANSSRTTQHPGIALNADHRIMVQGANGAAVAGEVAVRQTTASLQ